MRPGGVQEICQLVALQLGLAGVRPDDRLAADLGAESADVLNIVAAAEDRYGVEIAEEEIAELDTPARLYARLRRGDVSAEG
jgi:acyl carrier protein